MSTVRCANCGKRLAPATRVCPACGANQPAHIHRIRCNYCSRRIPADSATCPHCKHNPRGLYLHPRLLFGSVGVVALAALVYAALNPSLWIKTISLPDTPTPTVTPTATGVTALVVTATLAPSVTATDTDTPTAVPTATVSPVITPTATATPTRRPVIPLPSPSLTPTATSYPAPILIAPSNGAKLSGAKQRILLTFTSHQSLEANQWFRVEVIFKSRTNSFANWCGWTKGHSIQFPTSYYDDSWQLDRAFHWHVVIAKAESESPVTCAANSTNVSPLSSEWTFYWY